ncbi:MAG: thiosulfate oxidation carrier protein SoxY [Sulfurimonas sp.]|jgi:sulfur-oxidizing protein SoxY|nr:thiosulfate oxidation carrier protein SoxY [Sulfurimonadaceae bacterium]
MQRRKFLSVSAATLAVASVVPSALSATDFRAAAPAAWEAANSADAIKAMFGDVAMVEGGIDMKAPKLAENGGAVPIGIKSDLDLESIALFQDANPRSAVVVFDLPAGTKADVMTKIKMRKTADVTVVAKGRDGKVYKAVQKVEVSIGGCGG